MTSGRAGCEAGLSLVCSDPISSVVRAVIGVESLTAQEFPRPRRQERTFRHGFPGATLVHVGRSGDGKQGSQAGVAGGSPSVRGYRRGQGQALCCGCAAGGRASGSLLRQLPRRVGGDGAVAEVVRGRYGGDGAMGVYWIAVFEVLDRAGSEWTRARPGRPVAARATCSTASGSGGSMGRGCSMQDRLMAGTGSWRAALAGTKRRHRIIGPGSPFGIPRPTGAAASRHSRDGGR